MKQKNHIVKHQDIPLAAGHNPDRYSPLPSALELTPSIKVSTFVLQSAVGRTDTSFHIYIYVYVKVKMSFVRS